MNALLTLIRYAMMNIDELPPKQQAEIYDALGELLPDNEVRIAANRLAFAIRETNKLQLDFTKQLSGPFPGNQEVRFARLRVSA